jgi:hypothetical protein
MNTRFQQLFFGSGLAGFLILVNGRSAHANSFLANSQPANAANPAELSTATPVGSAAIPTPGTVKTSAASLRPKILTAQTVTPTPEMPPGTTPRTIQPTPGTPAETIQTSPDAAPGSTQMTPQTTPGTPQTTPDTTPRVIQTTPDSPTPGTSQPTPGTFQTTPDNTTPGTPGTTPNTIQPTPGTPPEAVPSQTVTPGRSTVSGPSYVGIGGNIGFGGSTDLGRGSFAVFSKIGLTENISVRPAIHINHDPAIFLPVTVDFPFRSVIDGRVRVAPYVGGGVVISTGTDSVVRALITGGIDVPVTDQFTANASVNVGFFGD